jgi:hypothetical protein
MNTRNPPPGSLPAVDGLDYVRDSNWSPRKLSYKGWLQYANRKAAEMSKNQKFTWHGVVAWIAPRGAFRISFAGQEMEVKSR